METAVLERPTADVTLTDIPDNASVEDTPEPTSQEYVMVGSRKMSKVARYNWVVVDKPPEILWIHKSQLNVDRSYQRPVSKERVLKIAREFSWLRFLLLGVVRRKDGSFWIFDGQHRKGGADLREDVQEVPCAVFDVEDICEEAAAFLGTNVSRGPVTAMHKFRAEILSSDDIAIKVREIVEKHGYSIGSHIATKTFRAIATMKKFVSRDPVAAENIFGLAVELTRGENIVDEILKALFHAEMFLRSKYGESVCQKDNHDKLIAAGIDGIVRSINSVQGMMNARSRTELVCKRAIIEILNHKKKKNRYSLDEIVEDQPKHGS